MFSLNRVDIIGYQTQPITVRKTPGGTSVTDLNLVVPYAFTSEKGEKLTGKSFHTVTLWGGMADIAGQYAKVGSQIYASGRLQTDAWEDQETKEKRSKTKMIALDMILLDPKDGQIAAPTGASLVLSTLNRAQVIGNVTKDPEMRTTTNGLSVLTIGVATNERWKDKATNELKERTEFHNVVLWGDLAKEVHQSIKKGQRVFVAGRVQTRSWETQTKQKRYTTEIVADQLTLLGVKNDAILVNLRADAPFAGSSSQAGSPSEGTPDSVSTAVSGSIPEIKYESDIKPEDLPF